MASFTESTDRITKNRSQESETSVSSTESIIDASQAFRLGFPAPLPTLPTPHSTNDDNLVVSHDEIVRKITSLLNRRGITWGTVVVVSRRASATVSDRRPTILITAPAVKDDSWYLLLKDTQEYLVKSSLDKVCVEIYDPEGLKIPAHFPVEAEHPIVSVWRKLLEDIITVLDPLLWHSVSVVRRGYDNNAQSNPVTIAITSKYPMQLSPSKPTIQLRCGQYGLEKIDVCFLKVDTIFSAGGFQYPDEGRDFAFSADLSPGASIGLSSEPRATGTLGGKLIVQRGNSIHELGVTNFHIVASHHSLQGIKDTGLIPDHAANLDVGLLSPSNYDANFKREIIGKALDSIRRRVEEFDEQHRTEYLDERQERIRLKLQATMDVLSTESQALNNLNRAAGTVWAGSGFRSSNTFGMDWALISTPNWRPFQNKLPTSEELATLPGYFHETVLFPDSGKVEEYGPCEKGVEVFKRGRTTGLTHGTLSHVDCAVNFNGRAMFAWQVIGAFNKPFCDEGDSGSWVIDREGKWIGLLFACPFPSYTGDGYVIPILELMKDIETLVDGIVVLPVD
ncbi:hypothetical protein ACJ73_09535 [Blastomyces percursus]|uniref:Peptidase S7 domain-containing protein n=1 Tax=Blastomyces percursus TaxID=1658174 RepID=A0A1J9P6D3_9EURO|nr:hypothetical protein ACJ73_09535 [Blastomyces percursus]